MVKYPQVDIEIIENEITVSTFIRKKHKGTWYLFQIRECFFYHLLNDNISNCMSIAVSRFNTNLLNSDKVILDENLISSRFVHKDPNQND